MRSSLKDLVNGGREISPGAGAPVQGGQAGGSHGVDLSFPPAALFPPLTRDQALALQRVERGIEGALLEFQGVPAPLLDLAGDAVAVQWPVLQDRQHQGGRVPFQQLSSRLHGMPLLQCLEL